MFSKSTHRRNLVLTLGENWGARHPLPIHANRGARRRKDVAATASSARWPE
jgi:hypothetical protein